MIVSSIPTRTTIFLKRKGNKMKIEDAKKGMRVDINNSIATTHKRFESCSAMHSMKGKSYIIKRINITRNSVHINGYTWDVSDITPIKIIEPEPIIFHFDSKSLNI